MKGLTGDAMLDAGRNDSSPRRKRPEYQPKIIRCKACGASLSVRDEHSEFIVCDYCGSQLDISQAEHRVLGKNPKGSPAFSFEIGDSWRHRGARFECIGRMAFCEEGNLADMTLCYLFYNPRMGSMWIGEYQGVFSMTRPCHVMPQTEGLGLRRGDVITTWDKRKWVCEGSGEYELYYVDGALPWVAQKGDRVEYAEFAEADGSGQIYEIERILGEIEYGMGKRLDRRAVEAATGKKELAGTHAGARPHEDAAVVKRRFAIVMLAASVFLALNLCIIVWSIGAGDKVFSKYIPPSILTKGFLSEPFRLSGENRAVRIKFTAPIDNAWMALNLNILRDDGARGMFIVHQQPETLEYYQGYEGGEHWSEGSQSDSVLLKVPDPGAYRLYVQGVSAKGNVADSQKAYHGVRVEVTDRAEPRFWAIAATAVCTLVLVICLVMYTVWKGADE